LQLSAGQGEGGALQEHSEDSTCPLFPGLTPAPVSATMMTTWCFSTASRICSLQKHTHNESRRGSVRSGFAKAGDAPGSVGQQCTGQTAPAPTTYLYA
jgi:hypothetical protein